MVTQRAAVGDFAELTLAKTHTESFNAVITVQNHVTCLHLVQANGSKDRCPMLKTALVPFPGQQHCMADHDFAANQA